MEHPRFKKLNILVVDDNVLNKNIAIDMLKILGANVACASDGLECLKKMADFNFDLVFMDCFMPRMDGFQAVSKIKEIYDTPPPIIALTANALEGDRSHCLNAGFSGYLAKPFTFDDLRSMLDRFVG